jgi:2-methylisocitrate lyase-like PEP mutase family enzyme
MTDDKGSTAGNALRRSLSAPSTLVMPNVWDVGTARVAREAGFRVIGTSSAAIATMLGGEDAEGTRPEDMWEWAGRIVREVAPTAVNVDLESGYGLAVPELVHVVHELGCAGINIEDTDHVNDRLSDTGAHAERLRSLATGLATLPGHPVLTARVDSMLDVLHHDGRGNSARADRAVDDAIMRARAYLDAGADVVFPIGLHTPRQLRGFLRAIPARRTALLIPFNDPRVNLVRGMGVSRISFGATARDAADAQFRHRLRTLDSGANSLHRITRSIGSGIGRLVRP